MGCKPSVSSGETGAVGGHVQNLVFDGNKLTKMTAVTEAQFYRAMGGVPSEGDPELTKEQADSLLAL